MLRSIFAGPAGTILKYTGFALLVVLLVFLIINLIQTLRIFIRSKKHKSHFRDDFMNEKHTGPFNLLKWVLLDVFRGKSYFKLFGIWAFTGYYGQGKSLGAVTYAFQLKEKHPELDIKIYSNFEVQGQDGRVDKWEDLLELPKNTILIFDEIQSTFTSTRWKDFPIDLLWKLTQCRKHGLAIFCTTPVYTRISIQLRESVDYVIVCKNILNLDRWFKYTFYRAPDFEKADALNGMFSDMQRKKLVDTEVTIIARDCDYARYDTSAQIDRWDIVDEEAVAKESKKNLRQIEDHVYKRVMAEIERRGGCSGKR